MTQNTSNAKSSKVKDNAPSKKSDGNEKIIKITKEEELEKTFSVTYPISLLKQKLEDKIKQLLPSINLKGFRKGKVPKSHVKKMYGKSLIQEIISETMEAEKDAIISEHSFKLAKPANSVIEEEGNQEKMLAILNNETELKFSINFILRPEITTPDLKSIKIESYKIKVTDEEIKQRMTYMSEQNPKYEATQKGDRPEGSQQGDQLIIDFEGKIDGVPFDGGKASKQPLVLGSKQFIPGFEEQLIGKNVAFEGDIEVNFPEKYQSDKLAGKKAVFTIKLHEINKPVARKIDDEYAKSLGLKNLEELNSRLRETMENESKSMTQEKNKKSLFEELYKILNFSVPESMLKEQYEHHKQQAKKPTDAHEHNQQEDLTPKLQKDKNNLDEQTKQQLKNKATNQLRLSFFMSHVSDANNLNLTDKEIEQTLQQQAAQYPGQEKEAYEYLKKTPQAMNQVILPQIENKISDWVLKQVTCTEKIISREQYIKLIEEENSPPKNDKTKIDKPKDNKAQNSKKQKTNTEENSAPKTEVEK